MKRIMLCIVFPSLFHVGVLTAGKLPAVKHYNLDIHFALQEKQVKVVATLWIKNVTDTVHTQLPFLLYRLLNVERVSDPTGAVVSFDQNVVQMRDQPSLQVREVMVDLPIPLQPHDSITLVLSYSGFIFGYPEVMAYVKDHIDETYSLLRPDALAYPLLSEATAANLRMLNRLNFTYEVSATVPPEYRVACGGELIDTRAHGDGSTFLFRSKVPTWRIDVAVAPFEILTSPDDQLVVYHLPVDSVGAQTVLRASGDVVKFYSELFGKPANYKGYSIIEIPDGWGSQASDYYFLQTAAAFKDSSRIFEVYHEVGHTWNAKALGLVQRCRYFDEAFASFYEALAIRHFHGEKAFEQDMQRSRDIFIRATARTREVFDTPISGYGAKELGRNSYTKGAWSLYVLYHLVGEVTFASIIRQMMKDFEKRPINFEEFRKLCEKVAKKDLGGFFEEWIFGTASSGLLVNKVPIAEIVRRY